MINRKIFPFCFFIVLILFCESCTAQITDVNQFFKDTYSKYNLLYFQTGNFTEVGNEDYIVFYEDPRNRNTDHVEIKNIDKIVIFSFKNKAFLNKYEIMNAWSFGYDEYHKKIIDELKIQNVNWNGYCYIGDFNKNGLDEIIFFGLSGMIFTANIYEFHDNQMKIVLQYPSATSIFKIETYGEGKQRSFIIYDTGPVGKRSIYTMLWDERTSKYEILSKQLQK